MDEWRIRGTTKVGEISKRVQESRLKWYGHVLRREEEYIGKRVMVMEVPGKRKRGRPKRRWLDNIKNDLWERENNYCQGRKRKTEFIGGVSQETSTPHKSGKGCGRRKYCADTIFLCMEGDVMKFTCQRADQTQHSR